MHKTDEDQIDLDGGGLEMSIQHVEYLDKAKVPNGWPSAEEQGYKGPGWYFWDETGAYCYGPCVGEIVASKALEKCAEWLQGSDTVKSIATVSFLPAVRSSSP